MLLAAASLLLIMNVVELMLPNELQSLLLPTNEPTCVNNLLNLRWELPSDLGSDSIHAVNSTLPATLLFSKSIASTRASHSVATIKVTRELWCELYSISNLNVMMLSHCKWNILNLWQSLCGGEFPPPRKHHYGGYLPWIKRFQNIMTLFS